MVDRHHHHGDANGPNGLPPSAAVNTNPIGEHLLRLKEVTAKTGMGKTKIYALLGERKFPRPVKLGDVSVRWKASEIDAWIASLPSA